MPLPVPPARVGLLDGLKKFEDVDERVRQAFQLEEVEWALVEDLCDFTLPDYRGDASAPGYQPTIRDMTSAASRGKPGMAD
jgi:hypothetical protein